MSIEKEITVSGKRFELYLEKSEIKSFIKEMAHRINEDYTGKELIVIGVLDGVFMVLADLLKRLKISVSLELVKLKSYKGMKSTGTVNRIIGLTSEIRDKHILIVEDIVDTGETLTSLLEEVNKEKPSSLEIATLLLKSEVFKNRFPIKYVGKEIPNRFVIGYGMDFDGEGRQLPHVYALHPEETQA